MNAEYACAQLGSYVIALDAYTGEYVTDVQTGDPLVDEDFLGEHYASGTIVDDSLYLGLTLTVNPDYFVGEYGGCTSIGSMVKVNLLDFSIAWKTYTLPTGGGAGSWCGVGVIGAPAVDASENLVYFGTGPARYHPDDAETCFTTDSDETNPNAWGFITRDCLPIMQNAYSHPLPTDSVVALDLNTGGFVWTYSPGGLESNSLNCGELGPNARDGGGVGCPGFNGPDWGFGGSLATVTRGEQKYVFAGQQSGVVHGLDAWEGFAWWVINIGQGGPNTGIQGGVTYSPLTSLLYAQHSGGDAPTRFGDSYPAYSTIADGVQVCGGGTMHAIDVDAGVVVWESFDPIALSSFFDTFPPECADPLAGMTDSEPDVFMDVFKMHWDFFNGAGLQTPRNATAIFGWPCDPMTTGGPNETPELAHIYGLGAIANDVIAYGSLTGNLYLYDSANGYCVRTLNCEFGSIYGGVTYADEQLFYNCGYDVENLGITGDRARVYEYDP
jgi:hypothetical protein